MNLSGKGWGISAIFGDQQGKEKEPDRALKADHPCMRSLKNGGQADEKCKRILLVFQEGLRGINNWTILRTLDCTARTSPQELVQFNFGRAIRLPRHLSVCLSDDATRRFVTLGAYVAVNVASEKENDMKDAPPPPEFVRRLQRDGERPIEKAPS